LVEEGWPDDDRSNTSTVVIERRAGPLTEGGVAVLAGLVEWARSVQRRRLPPLVPLTTSPSPSSGHGRWLFWPERFRSARSTTDPDRVPLVVRRADEFGPRVRRRPGRRPTGAAPAHAGVEPSSGNVAEAPLRTDRRTRTGGRG
jgi:hypothetical protein